MRTRADAIAFVLCAVLAAPWLSAETKKPPANNLELTDVPEESRTAIEAAIETFREVWQQEEKRGGLNAAILKLENARTRASKVPQLYYYLGIAYQLAEKFSRAKSRLESAIKLNPDFYEARVEYGDVFVWLKDYKRAIKEYDTALELNPGYDLALERRAQTLIRLGRFEEAQGNLRAAIKIRETESREKTLERLAVAVEGPNWPATYERETANYIVRTSISQKYADDIADAAERIRTAYIKVFPKTQRPDRKYPIYVHSSREEYISNGGPPMAGGHYEPWFRILQLFQNTRFEDTLITLNHEAFHQFLDDYVERAPQWFNEGVADYFGAFEYLPREGKLMPRPNKKRLQYIQFALRVNRYAPPADLMLMSQAEMYDPQMVGIHYAQAWSMVYFMLESGNRGYNRLLVNYFKALAAGKNIDEAFKVTFNRVDLSRFEREWRSFVNSLR